MADTTNPITGAPRKSHPDEGKAFIDYTHLQLEMSKDYWQERYDIARGVWHSYRLGDYYRDNYKHLENSRDGHPTPCPDCH